MPPLQPQAISLSAPAIHNGRGAGSEDIHRDHPVARVPGTRSCSELLSQRSDGTNHPRRGLRQCRRGRRTRRVNYFATAAVSNRPPRIHSRMVRYCQLSSLPCQRWPPLWVARESPTLPALSVGLVGLIRIRLLSGSLMSTTCMAYL